MMTKQDLDKAKKAFDHAWAEAEKYGVEAQEALRIHDQIQARDTDSIFVDKAKRAMLAHDNWMRAAQVASKVMDEYYSQFMPK